MRVLEFAMVVVLVLVAVVVSFWAGQRWDTIIAKPTVSVATLRPRPLDDPTLQGSRADWNVKGAATQAITDVVRAAAADDFPDASQLHTACRRATHGGQRLRPLLLLEVARAARGDAEGPSLGEAAVFIEYLHAASLVVDDLPEFDNDAERRGELSIQAAMGPATARMASTALVAAAMQCLARQADILAAVRGPRAYQAALAVSSHVGALMGAHGASAGQLADTLATGAAGARLAPGEVLDIARLKTASFFELAAIAGWYLGGGEASDAGFHSAANLGRSLGLAYQLSDDLCDETRDRMRGALNYSVTAGRDAAIDELKRQLATVNERLDELGMNGTLWRAVLTPIGAVRATPLPVVNAPPAAPVVNAPPATPAM